MSDSANQGSAPPSAVRGIADQVVANTSLLVAVLVYMGWAYDDALYGYFHLSPLDLDVGIVEGWSPRLDITYVLGDSDLTRVELLSGTVCSG